MKRMIPLLLAASLLSFTACYRANEDIDDIPWKAKSAPEVVEPTVEEAPVPGIPLETKCYTLTLPAEWTEDILSHEILENEDGGYSLTLLMNAEEAAPLVTLELLPDDVNYMLYSTYDAIGSLTGADASYNLIADYPDIEGDETYHELSAALPSVFQTITAGEGYTFSTSMLEIRTPEEPEPEEAAEETPAETAPTPEAPPAPTPAPAVNPAPSTNTRVDNSTLNTGVNYSGIYLGRWEQNVGYGSNAPKSAYKWAVQFNANGTGRFLYLYADYNIQEVQFTFVPFPTAYSNLYGVTVSSSDGSAQYIMQVRFDEQTGTNMMAMYPAANNEILDREIFWIFNS